MKKGEKKSLHHLHKKVKNLDLWDLILIKLSMACFVIVLFTFEEIVNYLHSVNVWVFIVLFVVFSVRPIQRYFFRQYTL
jgi:hypothetical protein